MDLHNHGRQLFSEIFTSTPASTFNETHHEPRIEQPAQTNQATVV